VTDVHVREHHGTEASPAPSGATWDAFAASAPDLASIVRMHLRRGEIDEGMLATVRGDGLPRINPVYVAVVDGHLLTVALQGSAKLADLRADGRYALHAHQDPAAPTEVLLRGHAVAVGGALRDAAAAVWSFSVDDGEVFELRLTQVTIGERPDADAWPPVYRSWRAPASA
jgi:hypothetical protein